MKQSRNWRVSASTCSLKNKRTGGDKNKQNVLNIESCSRSRCYRAEFVILCFFHNMFYDGAKTERKSPVLTGESVLFLLRRDTKPSPQKNENIVLPLSDNTESSQHQTRFIRSHLVHIREFQRTNLMLILSNWSSAPEIWLPGTKSAEHLWCQDQNGRIKTAPLSVRVCVCVATD